MIRNWHVEPREEGSYIYYEYSITNSVLQSNLQLKLSTIILYIFLLWHAGGKGLESNKRQGYVFST